MDDEVMSLKEEPTIGGSELYEAHALSAVEAVLTGSPGLAPGNQMTTQVSMTQLPLTHGSSSYSNQELQILDGQSFPYKLWYIINNDAFEDVICWSDNGRAVVFPNEQRFVDKVLKRREDKIFKTESLKSFVRQLNLYGFHKISLAKRTENDVKVLTGRLAEAVFEHEYFIRDSPHLLEKVRRRCHVKSRSSDLTPPGSFGLLFPDTDRRRRQTDDLLYERAIKRRLQFNDKDGTFRNAGTTLFGSGYILRPEQALQYAGGLTMNGGMHVSTSSPSTSVLTIPTIGNVFSIADSTTPQFPLPPLYPTFSGAFPFFQPTSANGEQRGDKGNPKDSVLPPLDLSPTSASQGHITSSSQLTPSNFSLTGELPPNVSTPTSKVFTTLSPLSVLCASLFSPFSENPFNISNDQNGQALSLLAEQASLIQNQ